MSRSLDTSSTTQAAEILVKPSKIQSFLLRQLCMVTHLLDQWEKDNLKKFYRAQDGESTEFGMLIRASKARSVLSVYVMDIRMSARTNPPSYAEEMYEIGWSGRTDIISFFWDVFLVNVNYESLIEECKKMFEWRISLCWSNSKVIWLCEMSREKGRLVF